MPKRNLFAELTQGLEEVERFKKNKLTLKSYKAPQVAELYATADIIRDTREKLNLSRGVFAHKLRVSPRTLEKWEQGRAKPNKQASALILLTREYPDMLEKLEKLSVPRFVTARRHTRSTRGSGSVPAL
ncbi:MAG: helix-turn-helix domain-containing protein [Nitrospinae bacterium]|nr:helix-turn-helix domain-containing protein [Nitrospinota bacterium]MBF0634775.1 helix-turn-helix domain-containing protein [Nitrospinota bacterium]